MSTLKQRGFTLIELLVVLAILSILVVLVLPAYTGYRLKSQIAEGLGLASAFKYHQLEAYQIDGVFAGSNADVGLDAPSGYATKLVAGIGILANGVIQIEYAIPDLGSARLLELAPCVTSGNIVEWVCRSPANGGIAPKLLPSSCRNDTSACALPSAAVPNNGGGSGNNGSNGNNWNNGANGNHGNGNNGNNSDGNNGNNGSNGGG